jgi:hypothetical protein
VPRLSIINVRIAPGTCHRLCQAIENTGYLGTSPISSQRHPSCPNTKNNVVNRPSTHILPKTTSRTSVGHWPARKVGSTSGEIALMHRIPPGARNGPKDPRATQPKPRKASNGPSCRCPSHCSTTVQAVASLPSRKRTSSKVASQSPHDALCIVCYVAITRGENHSDRAHPFLYSLS